MGGREEEEASFPSLPCKMDEGKEKLESYGDSGGGGKRKVEAREVQRRAKTAKGERERETRGRRAKEEEATTGEGFAKLFSFIFILKKML